MSARIRRAIGLDIGGTKIAGGVVTAAGDVVDRLPPVPTPATDQAAVVRALAEAIARLRERNAGVDAVGVGTAGLVDWPAGHIRWAPNNAFLRLPLRKLLTEATGLPTIVDNDANAAAWGEARHAAGADLAFLTVGTGVGAGLILNGALYRGRSGIAAEVGHMIVHPRGGDRCGCGNIGCLEAVASGTALARYGREVASAEPDGAIATVAGGPEGVTGRTVHAAALAGDATARALFDRVGYWLGVGIASLVNVFDLGLVVVGGGLTAAGDLLLDPARAAFQHYLFARDHRDLTRIVAARLGFEAGWIGAGRLALDQPAGDQPPPTGCRDAVLAAPR
jgi:glucokinase